MDHFAFTPSRRRFLGWLGVGAAMPLFAGCGSREVQAKSFAVTYSDAEWRRRLSPEQYAILRDHGTERPYSSLLDKEKRRGVFACAGCDQSLFSSTTKFNSRTGWPSFWRPLKGAIGTSVDRSLGATRTEVHCSRCGGHLGHVFNDGPRPTGLRYCINGGALVFRPAEQG